MKKVLFYRHVSETAFAYKYLLMIFLAFCVFSLVGGFLYDKLVIRIAIAIAVAVGYSNVSYFCQSFREYYGISPQKYRNQGEA